MATILVDVNNDLDTEKIVSAISLFEGVNKVAVRQQTKTDILIQRMLDGEDIDDNEYFDSIPGFWEELDELAKEPIENCIPLSEVWPDV